jgi:hypothetical protein
MLPWSFQGFDEIKHCNCACWIQLFHRFHLIYGFLKTSLISFEYWGLPYVANVSRYSRSYHSIIRAVKIRERPDSKLEMGFNSLCPCWFISSNGHPFPYLPFSFFKAKVFESGDIGVAYGLLRFPYRSWCWTPCSEHSPWRS